MQSGGIHVVSFAAGEPDFDTPLPIADATIHAIREGQTRYCASAGLPALRAAIAESVGKQTGATVRPNQVIVSTGAKHALYNAMQAVLGPGDEAILIAPYWMTYRDQVVLAGATPRVVSTSQETGFVPDVEAIAAAITAATRAIVLNSPSNPTGAVYPADVLAALVRLAEQHDLWIISDEIYDHLVYDGVPHASVMAIPEARERTIYVNGFSKTFAMTGWRIGYSVSPPHVAEQISNIQDQVTSNSTTFVQHGAIMALQLPAEVHIEMRNIFEARRDLITRMLSEVPGLSCSSPKGAFYAFARMAPELLADFGSDQALAEFLLEEAHVACVPGSVFEGDGHLRMSYATSTSEIELGVERIARALSKR